jgi:DNA polymerase III alpha subunit
MKDRDRFIKLCVKGLESKGLIQDQRYKDRFKKELKEIDAQAEHEYFLNLYDKFQSENLKFSQNQHNNLVDFLLGLTDIFDIEKPSAYLQGEFPDIDTDYLKDVRDYLKRTWAAEKFGQDRICEIGTYGTSGIKSAMLDMARVHDAEKDVLQQITNKMADKDDEGHELEWEKALEIYPEFKAYCDSHPEVADAAKALLDRIRTGGVHAGGLIIADRRLDGFVPLEVRMVNKENPNGVICSAWTEGLNRQDLGPVGLIKFDLLVISNLMQIALACKLIKERHGVEKICALPGQWDFSDISYLNDPKSIEMANRGDLKCIFQFDSEGIRKLVKRGGVSSFDDLAAYSAIYRPGPLNMGMDSHYCKRKRGEEPYNIHPLMEKSIGKTYGVLVYQEQVMDILRVVGEIPDMHTEKVRKAISKKKVKDFIKYKEMFIENGQKNLGVNEEYVANLWQQIESFAEYGFNASHAYAYTYISARLLWLKAHYPLEFYTAILMCENDTDKFKDYKFDAEKHGIEVCPVHINKSKRNFTIHDNKIYFGFSNIKSIGDDVADRIVANQPYKNISDFLERFGTDVAPIKALTSLGVFEEKHSRLKLRKFAEYYKKQTGSRKDRKKRHEQSLERKKEELKQLLLEEISENDPDFHKLCEFTDEAESLWEEKFAGVVRHVPYKYRGEERIREVTFVKQLQDLAKKRLSSIQNFGDKEQDDNESGLTIDDFNDSLVKIDEDEEKILTNELIVNGKKSYPIAESMYYGFQWTHILETCLNYHGYTIDNFLDEHEAGADRIPPIEIQVLAVKKRTSKKGVEFYSIDVEDANGKKMTTNVWQDDYTRFREEWVVGKLLCIHVNPPSGGFNTLTFKSVPRNERKSWPPKEDDPRLLVRKLPPKQELTEKVDVDKNQTPEGESFAIFDNSKSLKNNSVIEVVDTNEFQIVMKTRR